MTSEAPAPRDLWRDLGWGVSRGVALACLPLLLSVLPGRLPLAAGDPRLRGASDANLSVLALGAALGATAGLFRPWTRWFAGSLALGIALAELCAFLLRWLAPARGVTPPFQPFGSVLPFGVVLGLAFYLGERFRRDQRSSLTG